MSKYYSENPRRNKSYIRITLESKKYKDKYNEAMNGMLGVAVLE